ncbi:HAD-IIA family hydrolase [Piscinibacter terrae]|uniref:HAD-IIA family hydrolase n=1 Tax=Piscinibacter terrae TaxID=2496871 RepID=A0A3N7HL45_9BURK|nr:HAD-IIA family hydrolase [Albitalea terrae]RQP21736.1 HAD-IIA family hydrolase [Albitalea terrae]
MHLKALLLDIDGTLMFKGQAIAGANETLRNARERGLLVRLLTNISARSADQIAGELQAAGIDAMADQIQTAASACAHHVKAHAGASCHLLVPPAMESLFEGVPRNCEAPDFVVVADVAERFDYANLNLAFRLVRQGATLLVPHRNLYWHDREGPMLDAGAFIVGLEAATGRSASITGKPSPLFFQAALAALGVEAHEAIVVGDDMRTDIAGAQALGLEHVLVLTGKGRDHGDTGQAPARHRIASIADLLDHLTATALIP